MLKVMSRGNVPNWNCSAFNSLDHVLLIIRLYMSPEGHKRKRSDLNYVLEKTMNQIATSSLYGVLSYGECIGTILWLLRLWPVGLGVGTSSNEFIIT